jgi:hypothetical protein
MTSPVDFMMNWDTVIKEEVKVQSKEDMLAVLRGIAESHNKKSKKEVK